MQTLYYPRIYHGRWYWCAVYSDESFPNPTQSCDEKKCHGHETAYAAVRHHAEFICAGSVVVRSAASEEMRRCVICQQWTDQRAVLSLCPFQDALFICTKHRSVEVYEMLCANHYKWRGVTYPIKDKALMDVRYG